MNIFYLNDNPYAAARMQCDKHVVKMVLETAQLLSTAHHICGDGGPYKLTHQNHPSAVWARSSTLAYRWLWHHLDALGEEYTQRYGKVHKTIREHKATLKTCPAGVPYAPWQDPPQCMPDEYKNIDTVAAYRAYYAHKGEIMDMRYYGR